MPKKVRHELADILGKFVRVVAPASSIVRQVSEAVDNPVPLLDLVDQGLGMAEHAASKLSTMTDAEEDQLVGKVTKATVSTVADAASQRRRRKVPS